MTKPSLVCSISFGKDSLAMTLELIRRGENVVDIVYFDTGWEFPEMEGVIARFERMTGRKITRLRPRIPMRYWFSQHPVTDKDGNFLRYGYGWPTSGRRWCTSMKRDAIKAYCNALTWQGYPFVSQCIGFAADEPIRVKKHTKKKGKTAGKKRAVYQDSRYPLHEWGWTEADALQYCRDAGFDWEGLYDHFSRVSCWCCPLGGISRASVLYHQYPQFWEQALEMETWLPEDSEGRIYTEKYTVSDLDTRFAAEDAAAAALAAENARMLTLGGTQ